MTSPDKDPQVEQTRTMWWQRAIAPLGFAAMLVLAGCNTAPGRAPVEDRTGAGRSAPVAAAPAAAASAADPAAKVLPGAENAGKPGYYTVKQGDVLGRIALEFGQNWKDIARWNNLDNANLIEIGQVLRVLPPGPDPAVAKAVPNAPRPDVKPLDAKTTPVAGAPAPGASAAAAAPPASAPREGDDDVTWAWPAGGPVASGFEEGRTKGLAITGKAGDPVLAAADGRVVYAGSGLRGYGNLVIIKHNATYLTAYAHNQVLLVKEDQAVRRGQRIAEMGSTEADRVQLHFEVRRQGKPVDPARVLPPR